MILIILNSNDYYWFPPGEMWRYHNGLKMRVKGDVTKARLAYLDNLMESGQAHFVNARTSRVADEVELYLELNP